MRAVDHAPGLVVASDRGAAQTLEHADLNLLGPHRHQPIEATAEAWQILTGQSDDQIGVDMHAGLFAQKTQVVLQLGIVLPTADEVRDFIVERLNPHFKLQRAGGEAGDV